MAVRREALQEIGGFDPRYRAAGDDVDVCWRLQQRGWTLGFSPAAVVWHHRRNSVRAYWKQQVGYGKAEALLEAKWPEKYNAGGHHAWAGRLYSKGLTEGLRLRAGRIYQGTWGSAPFQSICQPAPGLIASLPLMPEWYLIIICLTALSALGLLWTPLVWPLPLLVFAVGVLLAQAGLSASKSSFASRPATRFAWSKLWGLTAVMHLVQPLARLRGRLKWGLTPWRKRGLSGLSMPGTHTTTMWSEHWQSADEKLRFIEKSLREAGACVLRGGDFDAWDLEVRGGMLGSARTLMAIEEHGGGKQLARLRVWPKYSATGLALTTLFAVLSAIAALSEAWIAAVILSINALPFAFRTFYECSTAMSTVLRTLMGEQEEEEKRDASHALPEPLVSQPSAGVVLEVDAAMAGARLGAIVPPHAVTSIGSSLFRDSVTAVEASVGAGELRHQETSQLKPTRTEK